MAIASLRQAELSRTAYTGIKSQQRQGGECVKLDREVLRSRLLVCARADFGSQQCLKKRDIFARQLHGGTCRVTREKCLRTGTASLSLKCVFILEGPRPSWQMRSGSDAIPDAAGGEGGHGGMA